MEKEKIEQMPKVVLHLHLDGSLRPETVYQWLKDTEKEKPLEEVREMLAVEDDCRDLNQYLEKFSLPVEVLQTPENIRRATYELFEDLANQNVIYSEVRFAPSLHTQKDMSYDEIIQSAILGMQQAKQKYDTKGNLILCCMRGEDTVEDNILTVQSARKYLNKGVCGVDLAGAEALYPTSDYEEVFKMARDLKVPFTIHAGEADGPESVEKAIEFGAQRIGHGVRSIESQKLLGKLKEQGILLEVCPISNMQTQAVQRKHPLEDLYRKGISVSINTDNNTVSNTNIVKEYEWVLKNTNLNIDDLSKCNENAIRGAFITPQEKAILLSEIREFMDKNQIGERE